MSVESPAALWLNNWLCWTNPWLKSATSDQPSNDSGHYVIKEAWSNSPGQERGLCWGTESMTYLAQKQCVHTEKHHVAVQHHLHHIYQQLLVAEWNSATPWRPPIHRSHGHLVMEKTIDFPQKQSHLNHGKLLNLPVWITCLHACVCDGCMHVCAYTRVCKAKTQKKSMWF